MPVTIALAKGEAFFVDTLLVEVTAVTVANGNCTVSAGGKRFSLTKTRWADIAAGITMRVTNPNPEFTKKAVIEVEAPAYLAIVRSELLTKKEMK